MMAAGVGTAEKGRVEILGTTDPTLGTGDEMRGDMEGIAASWERRVTSVPADTPSPAPSLSPTRKSCVRPLVLVAMFDL